MPPPPPPPIARGRRWALFVYSMRRRRASMLDELARRSEVFRRLAGTTSYTGQRHHPALERILMTIALFGLSLSLLVALPFAFLLVALLPFGAMYPLLQLSLSLAEPASAAAPGTPSLPSILPLTLSAIYVTLLAALLPLLPVVHRFQSIRSELMTTSGLPPAFFSPVILAEMRRRFELSIAASATTVWDHECCVCMGPIAPHDACFLHGCAHVFHGECITAWLRESSTCPLCRSQTSVAEISTFTDLASQHCGSV
mmetsp:Transcript_76994/g.152766  ORF Transcript_76994/g.152766 Transcript_76994/m.152766 type:complete len:256 (-) Transcript_76994:277-1044(-)